MASSKEEPIEIFEDASATNGLKVIRYGNGSNGKSAGITIATFADQHI